MGEVADTGHRFPAVWILAIGLSVISAIVNLPIDERPVVRRLAMA